MKLRPVLARRGPAWNLLPLAADRNFFAGLIFAEQVTVTIGQCIRDSALIAEAATPEKMANWFTRAA